jgi:hypothetical protein
MKRLLIISWALALGACTAVVANGVNHQSDTGAIAQDTTATDDPGFDGADGDAGDPYDISDMD